MTGTTRGAGTVYPSGTPELNLDFKWSARFSFAFVLLDLSG